MTSGFTDGDGNGGAGDGGAARDGVARDEGVARDDGVSDGAVDAAIDREAIDRGAVDGDAIDDDPVDHDAVGDQPLADGVVAGTGGEVEEEAENEEVDGPGVRACLEAILLVADEPVPEVLLAQVLERPRGEIDAALRALAAEYTADGRGFDLREIAGGWRFYTREDCAPLVERFVRDGQEVRLTQAALETLAVIAYRQPVSRARVSAVRGVNCDGVIRTLVLRGLVEDSGTDQETGAILYRTTGYFLERLGMASLDELPDLAPFLPENIEDIEDNERTRA
jgi:segregation and condensation protein B